MLCYVNTNNNIGYREKVKMIFKVQGYTYNLITSIIRIITHIELL